MKNKVLGLFLLVFFYITFIFRSDKATKLNMMVGYSLLSLLSIVSEASTFWLVLASFVVTLLQKGGGDSKYQSLFDKFKNGTLFNTKVEAVNTPPIWENGQIINNPFKKEETELQKKVDEILNNPFKKKYNNSVPNWDEGKITNNPFKKQSI